MPHSLHWAVFLCSLWVVAMAILIWVLLLAMLLQASKISPYLPMCISPPPPLCRVMATSSTPLPTLPISLPQPMAVSSSEQESLIPAMLSAPLIMAPRRSLSSVSHPSPMAIGTPLPIVRPMVRAKSTSMATLLCRAPSRSIRRPWVLLPITSSVVHAT